MSKDKIQKTISVAGQKLVDIVKVFEQHGAELTEAEVTKTFAFLASTLSTVQEKARSARALSIAASGSFSFDMELPSTLGITIEVPAPRVPASGPISAGAPVVPAHLPPTENVRQLKPIGRIVGSKEKLYAEPEAPPTLKLDPGDEIAFLDPNKDK